MENEFLKLIEDILKNEEFLKLKNFIHHRNTTRFQHSINVAYTSFKIALRFEKLDKLSFVRGALLHDFYLYETKKSSHLRKNNKGLNKIHYFNHSTVSLINAEKNFKLNEKERDIIKSHMWPCYTKLPKYKESFLTTIADKYCSILEGLLKKNSCKFSII